MQKLVEGHLLHGKYVPKRGLNDSIAKYHFQMHTPHLLILDEVACRELRGEFGSECAIWPWLQPWLLRKQRHATGGRVWAHHMEF